MASSYAPHHPLWMTLVKLLLNFLSQISWNKACEVSWDPHNRWYTMKNVSVLLVLFLWSPFHSSFRCLQLPSAFKVILIGERGCISPWTQYLFLYCLKIAQPLQAGSCLSKPLLTYLASLISEWNSTAAFQVFLSSVCNLGQVPLLDLSQCLISCWYFECLPFVTCVFSFLD